MYLIHRVGLIRQIKLGPQKGLNTTSGALFAALPNEFLKVMFHLSDHRLSRIPEKKNRKGLLSSLRRRVVFAKFSYWILCALNH